jgi:hypothetical protein
MRSIGMHRESISTLASSTNAHNQDFALQREKARQHIRNNMVKKTGNLDSSQRTAIISSDLNKSTIERTAYGMKDGNTVKAALSRVRNSGCIPPKKKNMIP